MSDAGLLNEGGDLRTGGTASAGSDRPSRFDRIGVEQRRARGGDLLGFHVSAHRDARAVRDLADLLGMLFEDAPVEDREDHEIR